MKIKSYLFSLIAIPGFCAADGTVDFKKDVVPIIEQRPFFAKFLFQTFDFEDGAIGVTIGSNVSSNLSLRRIGPYSVCAKLKGVDGDGSCPMKIVIDTDVHFFDKSGKEIDGPEGAISIKEDFFAIEIDPPPSQTTSDNKSTKDHD